jgi:hypothetical protein
MTKLIALLAVAGAVAAAVFFWRKNEESWEAMWSSTKDTTSSWSKTVVQDAGKAADTVSTAVDKGTGEIDELVHEMNELAHEITGATADATQKIDIAAKKVSTTKAEVASVLADEVTEEPDASQ